MVDRRHWEGRPGRPSSSTAAELVRSETAPADAARAEGVLTVGRPTRSANPRGCRPPALACRRRGVQPQSQRSTLPWSSLLLLMWTWSVAGPAVRVVQIFAGPSMCTVHEGPLDHRGPVGVAPDPDGIRRLRRGSPGSVAGPPRVGWRPHASASRARPRTPRPHRRPDARAWSTTRTTPATTRSPPWRSSTPSSRRSTPSPMATAGSAGSSSPGCSIDVRAWLSSAAGLRRVPP